MKNQLKIIRFRENVVETLDQFALEQHSNRLFGQKKKKKR